MDHSTDPFPRSGSAPVKPSIQSGHRAVRRASRPKSADNAVSTRTRCLCTERFITGPPISWCDVFTTPGRTWLDEARRSAQPFAPPVQRLTVNDSHRRRSHWAKTLPEKMFLEQLSAGFDCPQSPARRFPAILAIALGCLHFPVCAADGERTRDDGP